MQRNKDYSFLGEPEKKVNIPVDQNIVNNNNDYSFLGNTEPEIVDTFLGKMQKNNPQFKPGTEEFNENIKELLSAGSGVPGMQLLSRGIGAAGNIIKNTIKQAGTKLEPYEKSVEDITSKLVPHEEAATKAATEHESLLSEKNPKPGLYESPKSELESIENELGKHLNVDAAHDVAASSSIANRVQSIEDFWSNNYKNFMDKVKDSKFTMPEESMNNLTYDVEEITNRIKNGADPRKVLKIIDEERKSLKNPFYSELISKAPTAKDINAADFLAKYKDFRDTLGGFKSDLKSQRYSSTEKLAISKAIDKGKEVQSSIKKALDEGLGEFKTEFDWLNEGYSKQIFPLRKNPVVKAAKEGKLSKNIINQLRTNQSGMPLLRDIIKQDPELLRNLIGQRYKIKPSEIHAPNELIREYLNEMPELQSLLKQKEKALEKMSKRKDIGLQEKLRTEKELKDIKAEKVLREKELEKAKEMKSKAKKKLLYGAGAIATPFVPSAVKKISKLFYPSE